MRKLENKVFSGSETINGKQVSVIVACTSQRAAAEALHAHGLRTTLKHVSTHWVVTGNTATRAIALAAPGKVFAASTMGGKDFKALPVDARDGADQAKLPKVPKDPELRKVYDKERREGSDEGKRKRGERRLTTWLPKDAVEALDRLTGGSTERGAVQAALVKALITCAAHAG